MKKFLVLYHVPASAMQQMPDMTPDQHAEGMKQWMDWAQRTGDKLLDMGSPLMGGQEISPGGSVKDSAKDVSGYSIVQAHDMEEAKSLFRGHPHLNGWSPKATVEIHEFMPMNS